jgi:selenide,water dikinase
MPQERFLVLLSTADGHAIAARGNLAYAGRPAWWLKDWIDRRFMARFRA